MYCWGPGCNGAVKACARLYEHGRTDVKEMLGGFEYWVREGFAIEGEHAARHQPDLSGLVCSILQSETMRREWTRSGPSGACATPTAPAT